MPSVTRVAVDAHRLRLLGSSALLLLYLAGMASTQAQDAEPATTTTPAAPPPEPATRTPPAVTPPEVPSATPSQTTPVAPGTEPIPAITVTPPKPQPTRPQQRPPSPTPPPPPERAAQATNTPQRTVSPSTPGAATPTQTQIFDQRRDNIFAPIGTASTTWSREDIEALPQGINTPFENLLLQFPGVSQDAASEGNYHIRNEHLESALAFRINGILLPDQIGAFGQFLDTSFVGSLSLITGALPAQYGMRTLGVIDIKTPSFDNTGQVGVYGGSRQTISSNIQYGGKSGSTEYFFTGRFFENILGIQNPTPLLNAIHDRTRQDRSFAYVSTIVDPTTRLSFIGGTSTNRYQIPNVPGLAPSFTAFGINTFPSALVDENQVEKYKFAVVALQKSVNDVDFQLAYFTRTNSVQFTPDLIGDLMFNGVATNVYRGSVANGIQADSAFRVNEAHTVRAGMFASMEKTTVSTVNQLLPIDGSTGQQIYPDIPFQAIDTSVLLGWLGGVYIADEWKLTDRLTLNSGMRFDQMWQYINANQVSPRISLTYSPFDSTTFHAGFARNFVPPTQVIAAPINTALLSTCPAAILAAFPACTTVQAPTVPPPYNPIQPERSSLYDIGVVQKVLPGLELGADVYLKVTRNQINQGQFGAALVLNGFNYERGLNSGVEFKALYNDGNLRAYANWAWATQLGKNVITAQYLLDADEYAHTQNNWVYADHVQVWTGSAGVSYLWDNTRFSADLIYGSGLRAGFANTDHVPSYAQVNAGMSREFNIPGWSPFTLRFDVVNVFDTSYILRNDTGIGVFGNKFGPRRGYYFGLAQKFGPGASTEKKPGKPVPQVSMSRHDAIWTWTGLYIGANAGRAWGRFSTDTVFTDATLGVPVGPVLASSNSSSRVNRAIVGGTAGYNLQLGMWLAGLETDVQFSHQRAPTMAACDTTICNPGFPGLDTPVTTNVSHNLDWFGTVRGRVGALITPDVVAYATGGLAFGEIEHIGVISPISVGNDYFVSRSVRGGWTAGGGLEARLGGNVTGKVEYLHMDFGRYSALATNIGNFTPVNVSFNSKISEDLARLGLNYKFDPLAVYTPAEPEHRLLAKLERPRFITKPLPQAAWTWAGYYFGANAGYAASKLNNDTFANDGNLGTPLFATSAGSTVKGAFGGIQTGYNWQVGIWVAGFETDVQLSMQRVHTMTDCAAFICSPTITNFEAPVRLDHTYSLDWFGTVRARLGAAVTPDVVPYVTGGFAAGGIAHFGNLAGFAPNGFDANGNPLFIAAGQDFTSRVVKPGWALGGGVEARLFGNVSGKVEYLHMDFGNQTTLVANPNNTVPVAVTFNSRLKDDIVRVGLNYKFDPNLIYVPANDVPQISKGFADARVFKTMAVNVPWSWTGYYLGLNAGYSWGGSKTDAFFSDQTMGGLLQTTTSSFRIKGKLGGAQTGYNWQLGPWVWGVEADAQLASQRANPIIPGPNLQLSGLVCDPDTGDCTSVSTPLGQAYVAFDQYQKIEWFATLRGRLGAALTPYTLLYITGGGAIGEIQTSGKVYGFDPDGALTTSQFSNITINHGWVAGGGFEARLCGNLTGRIEYLYLDLGITHATANNQTLMTLTTQLNSRVTDQLVRAAINYKFD